MPDKHDKISEIENLRRALSAEKQKTKRLNVELTRQGTVIESLHETTLGLMNRRNIDDLLEAILRRAAQLAGTADGYMYLHDQCKNKMDMQIGVGMYANSRIYDLEIGKGFGGEIWKTGKPLTLDNYASWRGRLNDSRWDCLRAVIGVPLKSNNEVVGIIVLSTTDASRRFSRDELLLLARFAEIASVALENARLYYALENELNERRRTEMELHLSTERLHAIFNNAKDYIYIKNANLIYIDVNPAMTNMLGISKALIVNKSDYDIFDLRTAQKLTESDNSVLNGETIEEELGVTIAEKSLYLHNIKIPLRNENATITGIFGIARDITDRKHAELEILSAKEAVARVERLASLGAMAAGISHEISQPLNSIKVTSTGIIYLYDKGIGQDIEELLGDVQHISNQTDLISDIIKHVRSVVHAKNESKMIAHELCNLEDALTMAFRLVGNQISNHGIRVNKHIEPKMPRIYANETGLVEVIINLLINAMEALDTIDTTDKTIEIHLFTKRNLVCLQIADNGPGIPNDIQNRIFEPFFTTKKQGESMGLGLSIMQSIVESYGGYLSTIKNTSRGAMFLIELPAADNN